MLSNLLYLEFDEEGVSTIFEMQAAFKWEAAVNGPEEL